jgi:hypothetical protein
VPGSVWVRFICSSQDPSGSFLLTSHPKPFSQILEKLSSATIFFGSNIQSETSTKLLRNSYFSVKRNILLNIYCDEIHLATNPIIFTPTLFRG